MRSFFFPLRILALSLGINGAGWAAFPYRQAPPLPPPSGQVVSVSTEGELQAAVGALASNTTVLIAPGTYRLSSTLWLNGGYNNVAVRGATGRAEDVRLLGRGMSNADYGNVPHGIFIGNARNVLIADLTIRDVWFHPIQLDPASGAQAPRFYNLRLINAGEQFIKSSGRSGGGPGVNDGVVEYCVMAYETTARSDYTNGVDVHSGARWILRNNLFQNIRAPAGSPVLAGPAVLMWNRSRDTITEGNTFLNCERGIAYGLDSGRSDDHQGGIIRNNFFHRNAGQSGDGGISAWNSAGTKILHNTVILNGTYSPAIEYRFAATAGVEIRHNLTDAAIQARDGASGTVANNVTNALAGWFMNGAQGDLHLTSAAAAAIDRAASLPEVPLDYDGHSRPNGAAPDIGADEFNSEGPPPPNPSPTAPRGLKVR